MANLRHVELLRAHDPAGVSDWNVSRPEAPDLAGADLAGLNLSRANLEMVDLNGANLDEAVLVDAQLDGAQIADASLQQVNLTGATARGVFFSGSDLAGATMAGANLYYGRFVNAQLSGANMSGARLIGATLDGADLHDVDLSGANAMAAHFREARLTGANLAGINLTAASLMLSDLSGADLSRATLAGCALVQTNVEGAVFDDALVYGLSAWDLVGEPRSSRRLRITQDGYVSVDDLRLAQFVYLILDNRNLRQSIDTLSSRGVLLLGRFGARKHVLDSLHEALLERGFWPMTFDFERPESKDFTETVRVLAGMSAFVIADITMPRSVQQESQALVPENMVPFVPIIERGEEPWPMFRDLWVQYRDRVLEPLEYTSIEDLVVDLDPAVIEPAMERRQELLGKRNEAMPIRTLEEIRAQATGEPSSGLPPTRRSIRNIFGRYRH
ncbi:MAG: pentapeptide repeat-containing protein [Acidimicrobiales bacterium]